MPQISCLHRSFQDGHDWRQRNDVGAKRTPDVPAASMPAAFRVRYFARSPPPVGPLITGRSEAEEEVDGVTTARGWRVVCRSVHCNTSPTEKIQRYNLTLVSAVPLNAAELLAIHRGLSNPMTLVVV